MKNIIPYGKQWIDKKDIDEVVKVLKTDWITQGPKVEEFEQKVAEYSDSEYATAVSSGTSALQAAYWAAGIQAGDEIITTPLTFVATSSALIFFGAKPAFVDIDSETLNIDPGKIETKINSKTKAIATVDFAGYPCEYDKILKIAKKYNLFVIEDAAHAIGSKYKNKQVGSFADMTIFSFHPVKTITTGEGGMVLTNNKELDKKLKTFRQHGVVKKPEKGGWYYEIEKPGLNLRLTDFQCALGISQMKKIDKFIKRRKEIIQKYNLKFSKIPELILHKIEQHIDAVYHLYIIQLDLKKLKADRKHIFEDFQKQGLGVQVHYIPLHFQPYFQKNFGYKKGDFPNTEKYYSRCITLPLFPKMTDQEVNRVIKIVKKTIQTNKK
ncbi:MAG: UDP-4-amino-4,6-dideoxy-N-acetyl-beta-L-altrosamine transaminase [bacterium]